MWRNPNYPAPEQPPQAPPAPSGREIAVFERPGKGRGPDTELRVDLAEYMGYPFINLRVWSKGPDGAWFPTRKGLSVKIRETKNLADSLMEALRLANVAEAAQGRAGGGQRGEPRGQRSGPAPRRDERPGNRGQGALPLAGRSEGSPPPWDQDFCEFGP